MNNIQSSSMSKFYLSLYDYAYELEYGCVLIMFIVYELVLSSCAMFLICSSLFFIVHQISMIRIRIRNGMMVHCAVMVALSLACHSEGVGPVGVRSCFQLREHGVQVCGNQWMCGYLSGRGVGGRVVTALSSFAFPHDQVFR
jgi:hypothetical protein